MTKGAVAKEDGKNRKSFGKNDTPNKQKILNAVAKTPNSTVKQIKTPKSGNKPQANGNASAKKGSPNGLKKESNEDEDEEEDDSEDGEEEEDSDDGAEEEESGDEAEVEGGEEEGDEEEESDEDDSDDDDDEEDSVLAEGEESKTGNVKEEAESDDDDDDDEEDEDEDDDDDDEEEEEDGSKKTKPAKPQAPKKEKSEAEKAAERELSIFIGNVDFSLTKEDVEKFLKEKLPPGDLENVDFLPKIAGRSRGYCFAKLANKEAVKRAMKLNGTEFHGRALKIGPKTTGDQDSVKFLRITNVANVVNDGQVLELLTSVIKLNEIRTYKRVRSNVFGTHGAVQLQFVSEESYKKVQKLNGKELVNRKIEISEAAKPLKGANDGSKRVRIESERNRHKGKPFNRGNNQNRGNFQQRGNKSGGEGGGRYFKKEEGNKKRPGNNFAGNKFNKKQKKE